MRAHNIAVGMNSAGPVKEALWRNNELQSIRLTEERDRLSVELCRLAMSSRYANSIRPRAVGKIE